MAGLGRDNSAPIKPVGPLVRRATGLQTRPPVASSQRGPVAVNLPAPRQATATARA